jgi:hypothetical protein
MVKEAKFFRKQADKAEIAARASSDAEVSESLIAMAQAYRSQAALIKKRQKAKSENKKTSKKVKKAKPLKNKPAMKKPKRKRRF